MKEGGGGGEEGGRGRGGGTFDEARRVRSAGALRTTGSTDYPAGATHGRVHPHGKAGLSSPG